MALASARNENRPLSPHLQVWKWGPHMLVSILHRVTGSGMATVGAIGALVALNAGVNGAGKSQGVVAAGSQSGK